MTTVTEAMRNNKKSLFYDEGDAVYGDDRWIVRVMPISTGETAKYFNKTASAFFGHHAKNGFYDAELWHNHPGDIAIFARLHTELMARGMLTGDRFTLDSAEVAELIGITSTNEIPA